MAASTISLETPSGLSRWRESDLGGTVAAISAAAGTLYSVTVDNTANGGASYLKLYDALSGSVTVGTTAPDWVFKIPASTKRTIPIPEGLDFATGLSAACVTAGGTTGTTSPTSDVPVVAIFD